MSSPAFGKVMLDLADALPYRRNTRVLVAFPVTISGQDEYGLLLQESTKTVDVGKHGIRVETLQPPPTNAEIVVRYDSTGKAHSARVVWRGGRKGPDGRTEIGVEFLPPFDAEGMWEINSPDDWAEDSLSLTPAQKLEYFTAREATVPPQEEERPTDNLDLPPLPMPDGQVPIADRSEAAIWEVTQPPEVFGPEGVESFPPVEVPPPSEEASGRAASDSGPPQSIEAEPVEETPGRSEERPLPPVNPLTGAASIESVEELMSRLTRAPAEPGDYISKSHDHAVRSIQAAAEKAASELQGVRKQIEESLQTAVGEFQTRLASLAAARVEELSRIAQLVTENFRAELEKPLPAPDWVVEKEVQFQLGKHAARLREEFSRQLKEQERKYEAIQRKAEDYRGVRPRVIPRARLATRPPSGSRALIWTLVVLTAAASAFLGFVYVSTQPVMRLGAAPPAEFIEPAPGWNSNRKATEQGLARAYWSHAVQALQKTYTFEMQLPEQPPPEFKLSPKEVGGIHFRVNLETSRQRYWQRLRAVWDKPQAWEQSYEWKAPWLGARLRPLGEELRKLMP